MYRIALPCAFALLGLVWLAPARGDGLKDIAGLEKAFQEAIQEAEPSVACVLVSRSEAYRDGDPEPGNLGAFSSQQIEAYRRQHGLPRLDPDRLTKLDMSQAGYVPESYGSAVVIQESGLLLTNYHVVRDATKIFVRLPGDKASYADVHAADPRSDLAVLRLLKPPAGLRALKIGDGSKAKKGQIVLSIANPFAAGFRDGSPSASWGMISNVRRRVPPPVTDGLSEAERFQEMQRKMTLHHYGTLLQTDARLNLGCSGGALIDLKGEMIGLTTALAALSGTETAGGYAVPMDAGMRRIVDVLKEGREVEYGFLGVLPDTAKPGEGVRVFHAEPWSPAYRAGLRDRDVILKVNDMPIRDNDDLFLAVGTLLAGAEAKVEVRRDGDGLRTFTVTLAKFYVQGPIIASKRPEPVRGLRVDHISVLHQATRLVQGPPFTIPNGVMIREVLPASAAAAAMLKVNDVITHVNGKAIGSPKDFYEATRDVKGPITLTLDPSRQVKLN
jgi:serine protease Do